MQLVIKDKANIFDDSFIVYLIEQIKEEFPFMVDRQKLNKWNNYLNGLNVKTYPKYKISAYDILISAINNLVYDRTYSDEYTVFIDSNAYVPYIKDSVYAMCKLITYGNTEIQGCPILLDCFGYYKRNINKYYDKYLTARLLCQ